MNLDLINIFKPTNGRFAFTEFKTANQQSGSQQNCQLDLRGLQTLSLMNSRGKSPTDFPNQSMMSLERWKCCVFGFEA
jgi:hypothetical protein